jgi:hypothetical protein
MRSVIRDARIRLVVEAVIVAAAAFALTVTAGRVAAEQGDPTYCADTLGARCMSSTYPSGEVARYCPDDSQSFCSTCWESPGDNCDYYNDSQHQLSGYSDTKP